MLPPTRRVHYFDHQFLRVEDCNDEQAYHLEMRRAHNRMLHSPGVAYGLALTFSGSAVTVSPGMALDAAGHEIVLADGAEVQVPSELAGKTAWLTIAYEERTTDSTAETGAAGDRRWEELPALRLTATVPADPGTRLVLGRVTSDASRAVVKIDDGTPTTSRRVAGPAPGAALEARSLAVAAGAEVAGTLSVSGKLGVGVVAPDALLDVNDRIRLRGEGAAASSAGLWLYQRGVNGDRAFVGMNGDNVVGISGADGAWGLNMDVTTRNVGIRTAPAAAGGAALTMDGALAVIGSAAVTAGLTAGGANGLVVTTGGRVGIGASPAAGSGPALTVSGDAEMSGTLTIKPSGSLVVDSGNVRSRSVITLYPNTDAYGDTGLRVMHPGGTELMALDGSGNLKVSGRVSDAKARTQVAAFSTINITNTVNNYAWNDIADMSLSLAGGTWLVVFQMGGVESRNVPKAIADFRILVDTNTQATYTTVTFHQGEWSAQTITMVVVVTLAAGTHTVKAQWGVRAPSSPTTNPSLYGCGNADHRSLMAIEL
jgi:hypothetical protein